MRPRLVIFDCDGTLVDSQNAIVAAMSRAFADLALPAPSRSSVLSIVGLSLPEVFAVLAADAPPATRRALGERYKAAFLAIRSEPSHDEPLFPGVADAIAAIAGRDDMRLGIATGKSRRGVDRVIERNRWQGRFHTIQTADDHPSKPHPSMILRAMAETGAGPAETVMIGDTTFDVAMARAAGVRAVGVAWGYHPPGTLEAAGAHDVWSDFSGLHALLDGPSEAREP